MGAKSTFTGVYYSTCRTKKPWYAQIQYSWKRACLGTFETERQAAIAYDRRVLELKLDRPTNILKRKAA